MHPFEFEGRVSSLRRLIVADRARIMPVSAEQHRASVGSNNSARALGFGKVLTRRKNHWRNMDILEHLMCFVMSLFTVHFTDDGKRGRIEREYSIIRVI